MQCAFAHPWHSDASIEIKWTTFVLFYEIIHLPFNSLKIPLKISFFNVVIKILKMPSIISELHNLLWNLNKQYSSFVLRKGHAAVEKECWQTVNDSPLTFCFPFVQTGFLFICMLEQKLNINFIYNSRELCFLVRTQNSQGKTRT